MELPMAAAIAVLFAAGTYQILRPNLVRIVMGFGLYANASNLLLITMGGYARESGAPFVPDESVAVEALMDPLPPDIILTAIVISFAVGALLVIVAYRLFLDFGTDDPERLAGFEIEDDEPVDGRAAGLRPEAAGAPQPLGERA